MSELRLLQPEVYLLKVTEFKPKNKKIPKKDGFMYDLYWVTVEDKNGNSVRCEYAAKEGTCSDCFQVGIFQYVKCLFVSPMGTPEIEPTDEPVKAVPAIKPEGGPGQVLRTNGGGVREWIDPPPDKEPNAYSVSVSGKSYTFAVAYAKDILAAEQQNRPFGYEITDADIERMFGWADQINNKMIQRMTF